MAVLLLTGGAGSLLAGSGAPLNPAGAVASCLGVVFGLIDFVDPAAPRELPQDMMRKHVARLENLDWQKDRERIDAGIGRLHGVFGWGAGEVGGADRASGRRPEVVLRAPRRRGPWGGTGRLPLAAPLGYARRATEGETQ